MALPPGAKIECLIAKDQQSGRNGKIGSVVLLGVGCATFTLTNAWCHPFEQGEMKGNESEEVGNLWMMSAVILLDTAVCHFSLLIFRTASNLPCIFVCVCV